jgi:hypothetical protein
MCNPVYCEVRKAVTYDVERRKGVLEKGDDRAEDSV